MTATSLRAQLAELWKYRELLLIFVQRDLKVRYKNSVLGFGWSLLNPLLQVLTLTLVLTFLVRAEGRTQNFHAYVLAATVPWLFFTTSLMDSTLSLLVMYPVMRRTYFPREIVPLASVLANAVHFLLATGVLLLYFVLLSVYWWLREGRWDFTLQWTVVLIPLPMLGLALFTTGLAMFLSVWTLYLEDLRFLMDSALKVLYWLVPVVYFAEVILIRGPEAWHRQLYTVVMLNPVSAFITAYQKLTLPPTGILGSSSVTTPMGGREWLFLGLGMLTSLLVAWAGYTYFNSAKWRLAERA